MPDLVAPCRKPVTAEKILGQAWTLELGEGIWNETDGQGSSHVSIYPFSVKNIKTTPTRNTIIRRMEKMELHASSILQRMQEERKDIKTKISSSVGTWQPPKRDACYQRSRKENTNASPCKLKLGFSLESLA
jgi:hypothetical protein